MAIKDMTTDEIYLAVGKLNMASERCAFAARLYGATDMPQAFQFADTGAEVREASLWLAYEWNRTR